MSECLKLNISVKCYGEYDVIVCGGGTAGCIAALAAARGGAKTLLIERSAYLGGMLTEGNAGITKFIYHTKKADEHSKILEDLKNEPEKALATGGIPMELVHKLFRRQAALGTHGNAGSYVYTDSQEFKLLLFEELQSAGVKIHLHSHIFQIIKEDNCIKGVVYTSKQGCLVAKAKYFIDATGDADVATLAGVEYALGSSENDAVVKEGLIKPGLLASMGAMYRIGGVDFDKFIEFIDANPERFALHPYGMMKPEDVGLAHEKGDMIVVKGFFYGDKYHTQLGFKKQPDHHNFFQIYNYPREGIAIGCVNYLLTEGMDATKVDDLSKAEYEVLYSAKRQVARLREEIGGFENAYVLNVPPVGIRETRHVVGEYILNQDDVLDSVPFEDGIGKSTHPVDMGPLSAKAKNWQAPDRFAFDIPYRILVAKGVDNLLLAGRLVSNTREAAGCTRPTVSCMVTGEAAGTAAAILSSDNVQKAKNIDLKKLRAILKGNGVVL